jgi:hypothetical protein
MGEGVFPSARTGTDGFHPYTPYVAALMFEGDTQILGRQKFSRPIGPLDHRHGIDRVKPFFVTEGVEFNRVGDPVKVRMDSSRQPNSWVSRALDVLTSSRSIHGSCAIDFPLPLLRKQSLWNQCLVSITT